MASAEPSSSSYEDPSSSASTAQDEQFEVWQAGLQKSLRENLRGQEQFYKLFKRIVEEYNKYMKLKTWSEETEVKLIGAMT